MNSLKPVVPILRYDVLVDVSPEGRLHPEGEAAGGDVLAVNVVQCCGTDTFVQLALDLYA